MTIKLVTRQQNANKAAANWDSQYPDAHPDHKYGLISKALNNLKNDNLSADEVDLIIGNSSFTYIFCGECESYVEEAYQISENEDLNGGHIHICKDCLRSALGLPFEPRNKDKRIMPKYIVEIESNSACKEDVNTMLNIAIDSVESQINMKVIQVEFANSEE